MEFKINVDKQKSVFQPVTGKKIPTKIYENDTLNELIIWRKRVPRGVRPTNGRTDGQKDRKINFSVRPSVRLKDVYQTDNEQLCPRQLCTVGRTDKLLSVWNLHGFQMLPNESSTIGWCKFEHFTSWNRKICKL